MSKNYVKSFLIGLFVASFLIFAGGISATDRHVYPGESIQTAVDSAIPGDTIFVHNGTYYAYSSPFVRITTDSLTLIGESRDGVILEGVGTSTIGWAKGIHVTANNVTIKNLTVQNFGTINTGGYGVLFRDYAHDMPLEGYIFYTGCVADNVKSQNNYYPMYALVNQNLTIQNCLIQNNLGDGMFIARFPDNVRRLPTISVVGFRRFPIATRLPSLQGPGGASSGTGFRPPAIFPVSRRRFPG